MALFDTRARRATALAAAALVGFVALDFFVVHKYVWMNDPASGYWIAKPLYVGIPLAVVTYILVQRGVSTTRALLVAGVAGIVSLQLYYTVVPVPLEGGGELVLGLVPNLTGGLVVHFGALALALSGVVAALVAYRRVVA